MKAIWRAANLGRSRLLAGSGRLKRRLRAGLPALQYRFSMVPVARIADILQGKIWAAQDATRRPSKRRKDLLDIERILDAYPALWAQAPPDILERLQSP
jgi:hypothetical protein